MKKIKYVMYIFLCMSIILMLSSCGNKISTSNKDFLENYNYLTNHMWSHFEDNENKKIAFIPDDDKNSQGNLCGKILNSMNGGATVYYEVVKIDAVDTFTIRANDEFTFTIDQENASITIESEDGRQEVWKAILSEDEINDETYEGEISLQENYKRLTSNLWESGGMYCAFMPSEKNTGRFVSAVYSYNVFEEISENEIVVYAKEMNRNILGRILFVVDRENGTLQMKTKSETINLVLYTPDEGNESLTTYEYIVKNLWRREPQNTIAYFQPINDGNSAKSGLIGEVICSYEIIKADDKCITCRATNAEENQEIIQIEIEDDTDYINMQFLDSGDTENFYLGESIMDCISLNKLGSEKENIKQMLHDEKVDSFYERLCNLKWTSKDSDEILTFTDKGATLANELYGEYQVNGVQRGNYFVTDFSTSNIVDDTGKVTFGVDWIENGELKKGVVLVSVFADSIELEWVETKDGTVVNQQNFIAE